MQICVQMVEGMIALGWYRHKADFRRLRLPGFSLRFETMIRLGFGGDVSVPRVIRRPRLPPPVAVC
jgi:hypothetical protein